MKYTKDQLISGEIYVYVYENGCGGAIVLEETGTYRRHRLGVNGKYNYTTCCTTPGYYRDATQKEKNLLIEKLPADCSYFKNQLYEIY